MKNLNPKRHFAKTLIIAMVLLLSQLYMEAQRQISLKTLIDSAMNYYPIHQQTQLYQQAYELRNQQIKQDNLPQLELNGKATYQNEVVGINLQIPNYSIPEFSKDQYRISLDLQQNIYSGNSSSHRQSINDLQKQSQLKQMEVELYQLKRSLVELAFALEFVQQQRALNKTHRDQLQIKFTEFTSLVQNGSMLASQLDALQLEQLKLEQALTELSSERIRICASISNLSGLPIDTSMHIDLGNPLPPAQKTQNRPEYQLMSLQQQSLLKSQDLNYSQYLPRVYAYATAGYGRPGFNYLSDEFDDFYLVGLGLNWKIWNWQDGKKDREVLKINSQIIETQKESFDLNLQNSLTQYQQEMLKQQELVKQDDKMIQLQTNIVKTADHQLKNGSITSSAYVDELQKLRQYQMAMETHKIREKLAVVNYIWALGLL
jgi:outer membrane protein TolC